MASDEMSGQEAFQISGYELREEIGRGGMGVVYRARDLGFERDVAIKLLSDKVGADSFAAARFRNEARITGQLQHPGIPAAHELGTLADGKPFLAMKLVKGATLQVMLQQRTSPSDDRGRFIAIFEQICHAVGYAHAHQVIHRDLKPSNVMVGKFGEVQIMDWGLAKVLGDTKDFEDTEVDTRATAAYVSSALETPAGADSATRTGSVLGTPAYMPPEQAGGQIRQLDARSDVFGLGAILCEILTGQPPYSGKNANDVRIMAVRGELQGAIEKLDASAAEPDLIALAKRCLAFKQEERPADGQAAADEVGRIRTESEDRARDAEKERGEALVREAEGRKRRRQFLVAASVIGAVLVLGIVGTGYGLFRAQESATAERKAKELAETERTRAEKREQDAIDAVKRFGDVVAKNKELKDNPKLESLRKELLKEPLGFFKSLRERLQGDKDTRPESMARLANAASSLGRLTSEIGDMQDAIVAYREALTSLERLVRDNPSEAGFQDGLARNYNDLGNLLTNTGWPAEAIFAYEQARGIFERLLKENPSATEHMNALASIHNNLGILLKGNGKSAEALAAYQQANAIRERLVLENPSVSEFQEGLADSQHNLGALLEETGKRADAIAANEQAKAIRIRLVRENPTVADYCHDLALSHNNLGLLLAATARSTEAFGEYEQAKAIQERIVQENPSVTEFQCNLGSTFYNLGALQSGTGNPTEALANYERAKAIFGVLARDNPSVSEYINNLASTYNNIGAVLHDIGKLGEAIAAYEQANAIRTRLVRDNPIVTKYSADLARSQGNLGGLLSETGKPTEAILAYKEAKMIYECLVKSNPSTSKFSDYLAITHNNLGALFAETGKPAEAFDAYRQANTIRKRLVEENPTALEYQRDLAVGHNLLGTILSETDKPAEALAEYERAKLIRERLARENPAVPDFQNALASSHSILGNLLRVSGKLDEALAAFEKAKAIRELLVREHPAVTELQNDLAASHSNLGVLFNETGQPAKALAAYEQSKAILDRLAVENPAVPRFQSVLGATLSNLALIRLDMNQFTEARDLLREAIRHQKTALNANRRDLTYRQFLKNHFTNLLLAAAGLKDAKLAEEAQRGLVELAASDPQFEAIDERLAKVVGGESARDVAEVLAFGQRTYDLRKFAQAARFYGEAIERDAALAENRENQTGYNAACSAALAASGQSIDEPQLDDAAKLKLRGQALGWLKGELAQWEKALEKPESGADAVQTLEHWQKDFDLASVREAAELEKLPDSERAEWAEVWRRVSELKTKAETAVTGEIAPEVKK